MFSYKKFSCRWEAARCLAKSLKVIENGTIHRSHTSSYSSSIVNYGHILRLYPSFSSVTLDTVTHAMTGLHLWRYCRAHSADVFWNKTKILVETRQFLIPPVPLNLNVDIQPLEFCPKFQHRLSGSISYQPVQKYRRKVKPCEWTAKLRTSQTDDNRQTELRRHNGERNVP